MIKCKKADCLFIKQSAFYHLFKKNNLLIIIMKIIKQVELIAAAPKTVPPRLKITLKLTEIPKAAIAIPKNTYAA